MSSKNPFTPASPPPPLPRDLHPHVPTPLNLQSKLFFQHANTSLLQNSLLAATAINEAIVADLDYLEPGFEFGKIWTYAAKFFRLVGPSIVFSLGFIFASFMNSIAFYLCNFDGNNHAHAAFGLALFINLFLVVGIILAIIDKTTLVCTIRYGSKDFAGMKKAFWQSITLNLLLLIFYFLTLFVGIDNILYWTGFELEMVEQCTFYFKELFKIYVIYCVQLQIKSIVAPQANEEVLIATTFINLTVGIFIVWVYCWYLNRGLQGWFTANMIYRTWELGITTILYYCTINHRTRGIISLKELCRGYKTFLCDTFVYVLGSYSEQISFEISTLLVSMTKDSSQIAAQTAFVNAAYYIYEIGLGFAVVGRGRFTHLLGQKKQHQAKRFLFQMIFGMLGLSIIIGILMYIFQGGITSIYTSKSPDIEDYFSQLILVYTMTFWLEFIFSYIYTVARCLGWINLLAWLNIIFLVVSQLAIGLYIVRYEHKTCVEIMLTVYLLEAALLLILVIRLVGMDWNCAKLVEENVESAEEIGLISDKYVPLEKSITIYEDSSGSRSSALDNNPFNENN